MLPEGALRAPNEGLEASGAPLGAMWAQSGRQELFKSLLVAAWGRTKIMGCLLGACWGEKLIDFNEYHSV